MGRTDPPEVEEGLGHLGLADRQRDVPVYRLVDLADEEEEATDG